MNYINNIDTLQINDKKPNVLRAPFKQILNINENL